jgi:hypothetical protein
MNEPALIVIDLVNDLLEAPENAGPIEVTHMSLNMTVTDAPTAAMRNAIDNSLAAFNMARLWSRQDR